MSLSSRSFWALFAAALVCASAASAAARPVRRIVSFAPGTSVPEMRAAAEAQGLIVVHELPLIHALAVQYPGGGVSQQDFKLRLQPGVLNVQPDVRRNWLYAGLPELPGLDAVMAALGSDEEDGAAPPAQPEAPVGETEDAAQETPWGIGRVSAPKAWAATRGAGVRVAVVDTGIQLDHPDLAGNVEGSGFNATYRPAGHPDREPVCEEVPKEDGSDETETQCEAREFSDDPSGMDDHGHGTHVAGTIAALDDGKGVVGVAPAAKVLAVKVLDKNGSGYISDIVAGLQWAIEQKVDVINMSLGGPSPAEPIHDAVKAAVEAGITVVCAAGNNGGAVGFPGAYEESIAVAALKSDDSIIWWSSHGPEVDVAAPGVDVLSTVLGGGYASYSGTSMASPHVAGLAALAIASGVQGRDAVKAALEDAATPVADVDAERQGRGVTNAAVMLGLEAKPEPAQPAEPAPAPPAEGLLSRL